MSNENKQPYEAFGARIKFLREQWQQTLSEVSGTLEIEEASLIEIEAGKSLPPGDVLDMLISHFLLTEDQAQDLRDLVEDQNDQTSEALINGLEDFLTKQVVMYMPVDGKVVYTDNMQATVNDYGVILEFMQRTGPGQPSVVSRIGMSRDHAEKIIEVMQNTLRQHDQGNGQKFLPGSSNTKDKEN